MLSITIMAGLKPYAQYLEELEKMYPNVPYDKIKEVEKKFFDEREMKDELNKLDIKYAKKNNKI